MVFIIHINLLAKVAQEEEVEAGEEVEEEGGISLKEED